MEYKGEIIGKCMSDKRERLYKMNSIDSVYMFSVSDEMIVDATMTGNKAGYINHSCEPNCDAKYSLADRSIKCCTIRGIFPCGELAINCKMSQDGSEEFCNCKTRYVYQIKIISLISFDLKIIVIKLQQ